MGHRQDSTGHINMPSFLKYKNKDVEIYFYTRGGWGGHRIEVYVHGFWSLKIKSQVPVSK